MAKDGTSPLGSGSSLSGLPISLIGEGAVILKKAALFMTGGIGCLAVWCRAEEATEEMRSLRIRSSDCNAIQFEGLEGMYRSTS